MFCHVHMQKVHVREDQAIRLAHKVLNQIKSGYVRIMVIVHLLQWHKSWSLENQTKIVKSGLLHRLKAKKLDKQKETKWHETTTTIVS